MPRATPRRPQSPRRGQAACEHKSHAPRVNCRLVVQAAIGAINFYEGWTAFQLPLPKFDLVAVPGKTGAMENWGLLLFDEFRFLLNHVRPHLRLLAAALWAK